MLDKIFETFRKTAESSLRAQQDVFKQWGQPWPFSAPFSAPGSVGAMTDWNETMQKRWLDSLTETLNNHREFVNSTYKSGIQMLEQSFRAGGAKSPEDYQRMLEDLWHKMSESFKEQSEAQIRDFQKAAEKWSSVTPKAKA